jgi:hypothetical protein
MQDSRIHRLPKRLLWEVPEPNDRTSPRFWIIGIAANLAPENRARRGRGLSRKGILQHHKPIANKLLSLRIAQDAMRHLFA